MKLTELQILTVSEKAELLKTAVYVSSEDSDYFVVRDGDGYIGVVVSTTTCPDSGDDCHEVLLLKPTSSLDEAMVWTLYCMVGDNNGEHSSNPTIARIAPMINHYA